MGRERGGTESFGRDQVGPMDEGVNLGSVGMCQILDPDHPTGVCIVNIS